MAISANSVFEVRTTGSNSNSGGFVTGAAGTDYSQQDAAQYSFANLASSNGTNATPSVTSVSHSFVSADVGNLIRITAGTSWTQGWFQITSVSAGAAVLDRACGSSASLSSGSFVVGGALLAPAIAASAATVAGNTIYIKSGAYTITTASTNIAAGCLSIFGGVVVCGYSTNRVLSNTDTQPSLTLSSVSAATILTGTALAINLLLDGASNTTSRGTNTPVYKCKLQNFTNGAAVTTAFFCEATGCSASAPFASSLAVCCSAHGNSITSFTSSAIFCIAYANTATGYTLVGGAIAYGCVAYGNTGATTDGFQKATSGSHAYVNCIAEANGRNGFNIATTAATGVMVNCASYNNTSSDSLSTVLNIGAITLSGSPFVAGGSQDFSLNTTAGAGALLRGAGYAVIPAISLSVASFPDVGAVQHPDPVGSGGVSRGRQLLG